MTDALELAKKKVEERARAKKDKFFLANEVLGYDFQWETHAELFACYIPYKEKTSWDQQSEVKDRMILWSRGHYKTTSIIVEIIQMILNNPNVRILIMQGSLKVTQTLLKQILAHFTGEAFGSRFMELFPEFCGTKDKLEANKSQFTTTARTMGQLAQATVTCASPKSVKTGQHYDAGFCDDLVNDQNFRNSKLIEKVREDFTLAQSLIDPGCYRFVSGTRYAFGDLYETIMRWSVAGGKWIVSIKDCWTDDSISLPDAQKKPRFPKFVKKTGERGGFTTEELLQMQSDDPATFACQYLNKPIHSSKQAYTRELLEGARIDFKDTPALSQAILVVDLASSEEETADDSVIECGRIDATGVGYLCDMRGGQWSPHELALNVIDMTLRHRPVKVMFENTASCKFFIPFLQAIAKQKNIFIPTDNIKVDNRADAKNMRVVALAGVVKRNRFKFISGLPNWEKLIEQAERFPKNKYGHDDYIDTAALLYQMLTKEILSLPGKSNSKHPILAMMEQRENDLANVFVNPEPQPQLSDVTGLD